MRAGSFILVLLFASACASRAPGAPKRESLAAAARGAGGIGFAAASSSGALLVDSGLPGPLVLVVGGIHGDEPSGSLSAGALPARLRGKLRRGAAAIVETANPAAVALASRAGPDGIDMNRSFGADSMDVGTPYSGDAGDDLLRRARIIFDLALASDLTIDLHESGPAWTDSRGAAIVATPAAAELAMSLLDDPAEGLRGLSLAGAAPAGSLNGELAARSRAAITIEVPASLPLDERLLLELRIVEAILDRLGMLEE